MRSRVVVLLMTSTTDCVRPSVTCRRWENIHDIAPANMPRADPQRMGSAAADRLASEMKFGSPLITIPSRKMPES